MAGNIKLALSVALRNMANAFNIVFPLKIDAMFSGRFRLTR
jgi:hypothetical protein